MYRLTLADLLEAAKFLPVVPNFVPYPDSGLCSCGKADCKSPGKHPMTPNGVYGSTRDAADLAKWLRLTGGAMNIGFRLGDGVAALDVDPRNGGDESLARLVAVNGPLPRTPSVLTGGSGWHYYFRCKQGQRSFSPAPDLEVKADGWQVIGPPSMHFSGKGYRWEVRPEDCPLAELPPWLAEMVVALVQNPGPGQAVGLVLPGDFLTCPGVGAGRRHKTMCEYAGRHFGRGENLEDVLPLALAWATRCKPALDKAEVHKHVPGLWARSQARGEGLQAEQLPPAPVPSTVTDAKAGKEGIILPAPPEIIPSFPPSDKTTGQAAEAEIIPSFPSIIVVEDDSPGLEAGDHSFLPEPEGSRGEEREGVVPPEARPAVVSLPEECYAGLMGDILRAVEPEVEADPAGVLACLLTAFGNAIGPGPYVAVGPDKHRANEFCLLVGETSCRKGVATGLVSRAEPVWAGLALAYGLGTGEGLIERVRDGGGEGEDADPGVMNKRVLAVEREFVSVFRRCRREGNTLADVIRNAWDGTRLEAMNRRKNALKATGHHVSIIGHITPEELAQALGHGTEAVNGFLNRFLIVRVTRARKLSNGGKLGVLDGFVPRLAESLAKARATGEVRRTAEADRLWHGWYMSLEDRAGVYGSVTARAEPHVLRLSLIYALADGAEAIGGQHLKAALGLWRYCDLSAWSLFRAKEETTPSQPLPERVLAAIRGGPGLSRSDLLRRWRKVDADALGGALDYLKATDQAHPRPLPSKTRPAEGWFPGPDPVAPTPAVKEGMISADQAQAGEEQTAGKEGMISGDLAQAGDKQPSGKEGMILPEPSDEEEMIPSFPAIGEQPGDVQAGAEMIPSFPAGEQTGPGEGQGKGVVVPSLAPADAAGHEAAAGIGMRDESPCPDAAATREDEAVRIEEFMAGLDGP